jgi:hypothetical protein
MLYMSASWPIRACVQGQDISARVHNHRVLIVSTGGNKTRFENRTRGGGTHLSALAVCVLDEDIRLKLDSLHGDILEKLYPQDHGWLLEGGVNTGHVSVNARVRCSVAGRRGNQMGVWRVGSGEWRYAAYLVGIHHLMCIRSVLCRGERGARVSGSGLGNQAVHGHARGLKGPLQPPPPPLLKPGVG